MSTDLPEASMKALNDAAWAYMRRVKEIVAGHSDEELLAFGGKLETVHPMVDFDGFARFEARLEAMWRPVFKRAAEVMDRPGNSGLFCVFHSCDGKDCGFGTDEHDDRAANEGRSLGPEGVR